MLDLEGQKLDMLKLYKIYNERIWTESRRFPYVNVLLVWIVVLSISRSEIVFSDLPATEVIDKSFILNIIFMIWVVSGIRKMSYYVRTQRMNIRFLLDEIRILDPQKANNLETRIGYNSEHDEPPKITY